MSVFTKDPVGGWCTYFTVIQPEPNFPYGRDAYGLVGPFADEAEAKQARDIIATKREGKIHVMRCSFDTDYSPEMFEGLGSLQDSARCTIAELAA